MKSRTGNPIINFAELKATAPNLYQRFTDFVGFAAEWETWELMPDTVEPWKTELTQWWEEQERLKTAPRKIQEPEIFRIDPTEAEQRRRAEQAEKDELAAKQMMEEYERQGLEPSKHNAEAIGAWISENLKGYFSAQGIVAAVANLGQKGSNVLRWKAKQPAAPVQPAEVEKLPNGEERLPLGTTPSPKYSVAQLRDLDARERAARPRNSGWHGTKF